MMEVRSDDARTNVIAGISSQPIALAAAALVIIVVGAVSIALWRAATGASPEQDRTASARLLQARAAQVSEQLIEKTKGLEVSQQESIDQLQVVQDQLKIVKSLLTAQQTETKRLSEQVGNLASAIDTLRQSFASTQSSSEASKPASTRKTSVRRPYATRGRVAGAHRKRAKSRG